MEQSDDSPKEEVSHPEQAQQTSVSQVPQKTAPLGVKILSIISWIVAGLLILWGFVILFISFLVNKSLQLQGSGVSTLVPGDVFVLVLVVFSLGILHIFIAKGLWKGKNWTRILLIIFSSISIFVNWGIIIAIGLDGNQGRIFVNFTYSYFIVIGVVIGYLLFSKKVKAFFKSV